MPFLGLLSNAFSGGTGVILLLLALLFFGAKRLPELARGLGTAIREFNNAKDEVEKQLGAAPVAPAQPAALAVQPQTPQPGVAAAPLPRDPLTPATPAPATEPTAVYEDPYKGANA